jgi:hypothetical protein
MPLRRPCIFSTLLWVLANQAQIVSSWTMLMPQDEVNLSYSRQ